MNSISATFNDGLHLHVQVTVEMSLTGKRTAKIARLSSEEARKLIGHRMNDITFIVFHWGQPKTPKHIVPCVDRNTLLAARLYWLPETFKDKSIVEKVTYQIRAYLKNKIDTAESWQNYIKTHFQGDDWVFRDYVTLD